MGLDLEATGQDMGQDDIYKARFPDGFAWGVATAAYQIEGAWQQHDKGESIWDRFCHQPGNVINNDTGDVTCDSYHKWKDDINCLKTLGVSHYRLSLSWSRLLPDGTSSNVSQSGLDYYHRVLDGLLMAGITPMVTLYHWDLPQALQDQGGWPDLKLVKYFVDYARVCFKEFGDKVKHWITFNEPTECLWNGYMTGTHPPGEKNKTNMFLAAHTIILAHAQAYNMYDKEFRAEQKGELGITLVSRWAEPRNADEPCDQDMSDRYMECQLGWFANPIYGNGDYPTVMKTYMETKTRQLGLQQPLLPTFTEEEIKRNKGTWDFFGLNHYTTRYVRPPSAGEDVGEDELRQLLNLMEEADPAWPKAASSWLLVVPWGLRKMLTWVKKMYNNPKLYITENGISDHDGSLKDTHRVNYYKMYINQVLRAIKEDGCDVRGYMAWSLMDNFEWDFGFSEKFGLFHVDFQDPDRPRTARESAKFYSRLIKDNGFV